MNLQDKIYEELESCHHVSLEEILDAREKRVCKQMQLLEAYNDKGKGGGTNALICFTMNIAGPVKVFELAKSGFEAGIELIEELLGNEKYTVLHREIEIENTGYTAYYVIQDDALSIKRMMTDIEDNTPIGRLFDIDILALDSPSDAGGIVNVRKIGRDEVGLDGRKCLICGDMAAACARSRRHSVEELQRKTIEVLLVNKK
ncbi:holo-ACP synthase [Dethiosulfatibacter aminovorans DSM 17477]|uniref:citrate lyase holo-[acyl-carrier protein] synthase n=1 Tax=Dethiosulfatibacter aminovorans DSM 17477 TaxID=1121476 RepID=A0A1M6JL98_9FIRM|nr:citrate lyase holo-[acyl-carrier protein] synthase [Dethiosulfatibacter aminovorans]SHJ47384.1 holo-ACP synthase [Dethiosulfatibacter aminovorans DSM 17477]